jgi:hypothetical protein
MANPRSTVGRATKVRSDGATEPDLSDATLERTPGRVLDFLSAVGRYRVVRAILAAHGYGKSMHEQGWTLLRATGTWTQGDDDDDDDDEGDDGAVDQRAGAALAQVDAWDEDAFMLIDGALKYDHPAQHRQLTKGLQPAQGAASVVVVDELLVRLDDLERGPRAAKGRRPAKDTRPKAKRAADLTALQVLASRGISEETRRTMRQLVELARAFGPVDVPTKAQLAEQDASENARRQALLNLRKWWESASSIARVHIKRRDYLIRLGLAERAAPTRSKTNEETPSGKRDGGAT